MGNHLDPSDMEQPVVEEILEVVADPVIGTFAKKSGQMIGIHPVGGERGFPDPGAQQGWTVDRPQEIVERLVGFAVDPR